MVHIPLDHKSDGKSIGFNIKEGTEPIIELIDNNSAKISKEYTKFKMLAGTACFTGLSTLLYLSRGNFVRKWRLNNFIKSKKQIEMFPHLKNKIKIIDRPDFKNFLKNKLLNYQSNDPYLIMLVEGYSGCGKTTFFQSLTIEESKNRPVLYITLSDLTPENWQIELAKQINYWPKLSYSLDLDYKYALSMMIEAIAQIRSKQSKDNHVPILIVDDIQILLQQFDKNTISEFFSKFIKLTDNKIAQVILISSDNSIQAQINKLPKMSTRLNSVQFPPIKEEQFINEINERLFEEIKKDNPNFTSPAQLKSFVKNCDSDMRSFATFYKNFDGNLEQTFDLVCRSITPKLEDADNDEYNQKFFQYLHINQRYYVKPQNNIDKFDIPNKNIKQLIKEDIIRRSYDPQKNSSYYEFHSETVKLAYRRNILRLPTIMWEENLNN